MPGDWRAAYLEQAHSDFQLLQRLIPQNDIPLCHKLHYLQMTAEKMAKGFLTPPGGGRYGNTHNAFVRFTTIAASRPELRRLSRYRNPAQFTAYVGSFRDAAQKVEDLSPEGGDHPNPEYPWEQGGVIQTPLGYHFPDLDLRNPKMIRLMQFIEDCLRTLDR